MKRLWTTNRPSLRRRFLVALAGAGCAATCLLFAGTGAGEASLSPPAAQPLHFDIVDRGVPNRVFNAVTSSASESVVLSGSPGVPVVNPKTHTLYVPIQCTSSSCHRAAHVVDVISTARCNSRASSGCRIVARARAGSSPNAAVIDERTDTVYVVNGGSGTVSVLNGRRCDAKNTRGCGRPVATIRVGKMPVAAAFDPATGTVYVANLAGKSVSVIDSAACNAVTTRGCGQAARTVRDPAGPDAIDVDVATDTVYAANSGDSGNGDTMSVIDGAKCNGHQGRGCGRAPRSMPVGSGAFWDAVDQAADTIYVANYNDGTVSVVNGARCNSRTTSGCGRVSPTVTTGAGSGFAAVDYALHTVFTVNQGDGTVSAINTRTCDGSSTSGCPETARSERAAFDPSRGYNANFFALMPETGTAYMVNAGGESYLSVMSLRGCTADDVSACRRPAPAVPESADMTSVDPASDTIYAGNLTKPQIDVINGQTCDRADPTGCTPVAEIPMPDPGAVVGAIEEGTHTLYASDDAPSGTLAVINTATCNASDTSGCAQHAPMVSIGAFPNRPVINPATATVYVSYGDKANRIAVVNAATCNATDTTGCGQTPAVVKVGNGTSAVAVSAATNTIYAPNAGLSFDDDTVSVINGVTCDGADQSGCGHLAATVKVGLGPFGVAVDDATHTIYVADNTDGDTPGTLSLINGADCNGTDTAGCSGHMRTMPTGRSPLLVAVDSSTDVIYVTDFSSAAVSILNGARCNAAVTTGCSSPGREQAVGSEPFGLAINQHTNTVYVTDLLQSGSMSIFKGAR